MFLLSTLLCLALTWIYCFCKVLNAANSLASQLLCWLCKQPTVTWGQVSVVDDLGQNLNALLLLEGHSGLGFVVPDIMKQKGLTGVSGLGLLMYWFYHSQKNSFSRVLNFVIKCQHFQWVMTFVVECQPQQSCVLKSSSCGLMQKSNLFQYNGTFDPAKQLTRDNVLVSDSNSINTVISWSKTIQCSEKTLHIHLAVLLHCVPLVRW